MMDRRSILVPAAWLAVAAGLLAGGAALQGPLREIGQSSGLNPPGDTLLESHPDLVLLNVLPGGLRAPAVSYLWIQSQELKQKGRYYDAMQKASLICKLQPHFTGVWSFQAWNMAWNISAATHTPQERWQWVYNGVKLLRDEAIPVNPGAIFLYKELAWIFFNKMGQTADDMYYAYWQRWASQMQRLLGAPPEGSPQKGIEAFEPLTRAPLDRSPVRQGRQRIQPDRLRWLLDPQEQAKSPDAAGFYDSQAAEYAAKLAALGVKIDEGLLLAYNAWTQDDTVAVTRMFPPRPEGADKALSDLINDPAYAPARTKLLSFVRAQVLWNVYRMDPQLMLEMMQMYGPLDWRLVYPHGLYWMTLGLRRCQGAERADIDALNSDRIIVNSLKDLTWTGHLTYTDNPSDPDAPGLVPTSDWRFIEPTHRAYVHLGQILTRLKNTPFQESDLRVGHINYLISAIEMLYASYRHDEAQKYYDFIKKTYDMRGGQWDRDLEDFVIGQLNKEGRPIPEVARNQISASLQVGYVRLAGGDVKVYEDCLSYARRVYEIYQKLSVDRLKLPPLDDFKTSVLTPLLVEPRSIGYNLSLSSRINLYGAVEDKLKLPAYFLHEAKLRWQCKAEGLDPARAFPPPAGLEEYRARMREEAIQKATDERK